MRKVGIGCGGLLALLVVVGIVAAMMGPQAPPPPAATDEGAQENAPSDTAAETVVVRVSGTQGVPFSGSYGTAREGMSSVDGMLGPQPTDYDVPLSSGAFDFDVVSATFQKQASQGELQVEVLVDGAVEKSQETTAEYGVVTLSYSPQQG